MVRVTLLLCVIAVVIVASAGEDLSPSDQKMLEGRGAQNKIDAVTDQLMQEMNRLEIESHKKKIPLFAARNNLLRQVKGFWGKVIENHPSHLAWCRGQDMDILKHLTDVTLTDLDPQRVELNQFRIALSFNPNPYFSDSVLWRDVDGPAHEGQATSGIHWLEGKEPLEPSFFNLFERSGLRQSMLDEHYFNDIAHIFRYEFWANPFTYHDLPMYNDYIQGQMNPETFEEQEHMHDFPPPPDDDGMIPGEINEEAIEELRDNDKEF